MKPIKLVMSAFGPYKDKVELDFNKIVPNGIFLITGDTGAGKTTIFDGISFALYGEASGSNRTTSSIRSNFALPETETFVELEFIHKNKKYKIRRVPLYKKLKKNGNGFTKSLADATLEYDGLVVSGISNVNQKIEEILSINSKQFKQISMLAQGEFIKVLYSESKERTEIFRKIFDTYIYDLITQKLGEKLKGKKEQLQESKNSFNTNKNNIYWSDNYKNLELLNEDNFSQEYIEELFQLIEKQILENEKDYEESNNAIHKIEEKEKELKEKLRKQEEENKKIETYQKSIKEKEELKLKETEIEKDKELLNKNKKIISTVKPIEDKLNIKEKDLEELNTELSAIEIKITDGNTYEKELEEKEKIINEIKNIYEIYHDLLKSLEELKKKEELFKKITFDLKEKEKYVSKYEIILKDYKEKNDYYIEEEDKFFKNQAGIIAKKLEENKPCPVCGSKDHPNIATTSNNILTKEGLETIKNELIKIDTEKNILKEKITSINTKIETLLVNLPEIKIEGIDKEQKKIINEKINKEKETIELIETFNKLYFKIENEKINLEDFDFNSFKDNFQNNTRKIHEELISNKVKKDQLLKQTTIKKAELEEIKKEFKKAYTKLGFCDEKEYREKTLQENNCNILEEKIKKYNNTLIEITTKIEMLKKEVSSNIIIDVSNMKEELSSIEKDLIEKKKINDIYNINLTNNKRIKNILNKTKDKLFKNVEEFTIYDNLYRISNGTMPGKRKIEFEQYVQATYFEMVLHEANKRLSNMTDNRYILIRKEESDKISDKIGLELEVIDNYNGKKRDVKSLSGGEAFKASLSLALGLSDVIQSYSGGVVIDTLFIDEGFGSLDIESRQQAIDTLTNLSNNDKLIGIISHVTELKEKIERKVIITKTKDGSIISIE